MYFLGVIKLRRGLTSPCTRQARTFSKEAFHLCGWAARETFRARLASLMSRLQVMGNSVIRLGLRKIVSAVCNKLMQGVAMVMSRERMLLWVLT